jgi:filamentous hemagglutinin
VRGNTNTIKKTTADILNKEFGEDLEPREWGRALEALKRDYGLPDNFHGKILSNRDFSGEINGTETTIGNIGQYAL